MTNHHQQQSNSDAIRPPPVHGGRFDFDDGGTYCGGWEDGKAHGFGVCTGPKGLGEFSGFWQFGYEVSGVYLWPSGNRYEGQWMSGKRHGLGVEKKGRWIYKGEWTQGFKGRYGVRISERSGARFEGTWANGLQDGYGVETYGDGGTYFGQISQGLRSGYGVRRSVPYGVAARYKLKHFSDSLTSLRSANALVSGRNAGEELFRSARKSEENRGGFVLRDRFSSDEVPVVAAAAPSKSSLRRTIMAKLRKQKSAGDAPEKKALNPFRSNTSTASYESKHSSRTVPAAFDEDRISAGFDQAAGSDGSDEAALMTTDPNIIESYMGEWKADKRTGFGIAERSDGLRYEGEWLNNKKNGYGITTNRDGSREEGKYKNNVLVSNKHRFGRILSLRLSKIHERAEFAASSAMSAAQSAQQKAEIAASRANNARAKAQAAEVSAKQARHESQTARHRAEEIAPDFKQPGIIHLDNTIPLDIDAQGDGGHLVVVNHVVQHPSPQVISHFADGIRDSQIIRQSAPIGFHQPTTFISPDFPMPLNQQRYVSPIFRSRQPPPQNCWRPASSNYGFSIGHHQQPMRDSVEIRPHRFSINSSNLQWQQQRHPPPSVCQHLVVPADLQEAVSDQDEPTTPEKPAESPKSDFIQPPPPTPPPTKIRRPPHNQKSVDMATLRIRRNTDEPESIPRLRRRKSLPSIVHLASSIAGGRYSADNSTVSMLFANTNTNKFSSPPNSSGREKTFVIENGIKKRIREVRFAGHIIETPPPPPLIQPRGEAIAKSSSDDLDTVKKLPLQWSIVDDSPRLPRRIVLETIDSSLRRSIPDNIDTAHVKGLSREEVCALSSKRRQELRDERRLRENPLLWLVVCALSYIRRHRLTASLIAVIDVILFLWWLFHSQGRSRPHGSGNGGGSGQPATT